MTMLAKLQKRIRQYDVVRLRTGEKGVVLARKSGGKLYILLEDDDIPSICWETQIIERIKRGEADVST